jgi:hypothetical protein
MIFPYTQLTHDYNDPFSQPDQTPWGFVDAFCEGLILLEEFIAAVCINFARCGLVGFGYLATLFPSNYTYDPLEE